MNEHEHTAADMFRQLYDPWPARADENGAFREAYREKRPTPAPTPGERWRAREAQREFRARYRRREIRPEEIVR